MDVIAFLQALINNARKIVEFTIKPSVDTSTEQYFIAIQTPGQEVERINIADLPASQEVIQIINNVSGDVAVSTKFQFNVSTTQTTFNLNQPFNSLDVYYNRVAQIEGVDYTVSGNNVVLTNAAVNGDIVEVRTFTSSNVSVTSKQSFTAVQNQTVVTSTNPFDSIDVFKNRVVQIETVDYNTSANNITFVQPLDAGDLIIIRTHGS